MGAVFDTGGIGRSGLGIGKAAMGKRAFQYKPIWCNVYSAFVLPSDRYPAGGGCGHNGGHTVVGWDLYRSFDESWE